MSVDVSRRRPRSADRRVWSLLLAVALLNSDGSGQERQTFRSTTRLVEVSVVVTDRAGNPVRRLSRDDFSLTDAGDPRDIAFFEVLDGSPAMREPILSGTPLAVRGEFSNAVPPGSRSLAVILLDRTNAAFDSQWYAHKHAEQYLRRKDEREWVALYVWDGAVRVLHDFSPDATSLLKALDAYQARVSGEYAASEEPPQQAGDLSAWIVDPGGSTSDFFQRRRAFGTFEAFELLAAHLKDISGRKNIVWLSEAFAIPMREDRQEFLARMRKATQALSDAQAALYPVDARGLVGAIRIDRQGVPSFTSMATIRPSNETMELAAEATGGRAFANTNDLAAAIRRATDDARVTYVIGYYAPAVSDGRFRPIKVTVKRQNVVVRHRSGYFAAPPPSRDEKARHADVRTALEAPLQATGITLAANATRSADSRDIELTLHIDAEALSFEHDGELWRAAADVMIAQVDATGRGRVSATVPLSVEWTDLERASALAEGITVRQRVVLSARTHQLRIVVRDVASGRAGSLIIPVAELRRASFHPI